MIICNSDGKILFFNEKAEKLFGYKNLEVVNLKRIYNLLHNDYIIQFIDFINNLNNKKKSTKGKCFIFLSSDNSTFKGFLEIKLYVKNLLILKIIKSDFVNENKKTFGIFIKNLNLIIRSKFLIGSILPFIFSIFWVIFKFKTLNYFNVLIIFISVILLHLSANTFNDYFDWISNRDKKNLDYILFSSGGSRAIDFNLISEKKLLLLSFVSLFIVFLIGLYLIYISGFSILIIGVIAFFSIYFYSAPPIHLASRYGLGELMHVFCLGPLITYGTILILSDNKANFSDFFLGFPFGLMITGCLLINEYPDSKYDKLCGKINLAVLLSIKYIPYAYLIILFLTYFTIFFGIIIFDYPIFFLYTLLILPYCFITLNNVSKMENNRIFVIKSCIGSFFSYFCISLVLILSLIFNIISHPW